MGLNDAASADDVAGSRKVRSRDESDELLELLSARDDSSLLGISQMGVLDNPDAARDHLAQIVRRNVGRHADRDARGAMSTVSLSRSAISASARASSRASVYRIAAGGSSSIEPKLPWPSTSGYR